jgi:hypothetical protein
MVESVASYAANADDTEAAVARESEPALAQAVLAHRRGDSEEERVQIWEMRKSAFGAMGKIAKDVYVTEGPFRAASCPRYLR